jgi:uncharacterized coiled-coil DUF342 family protein
MSSQQELVEQLNKCRADVSSLKGRLDELDREKESWFRKKSEISDKIKASIQKIKEAKAKRDAFTKEVKDLKPKRDALNKELVQKSSEFDKLKKDRMNASKSSGIRDSPSSIKQQIEKLEFRIETDTPSFEREKELMKKIKALKKIYNEAAGLLEISSKAREASEAIKKLRAEANGIHRLIQEKAKQSQALHEEIIDLSKGISRMRSDEEAAFVKFLELKRQFAGSNTDFKEKLKEMDLARSRLERIHSDRKERRRQEIDSILKSKEEAVNEKIKKRQKLTTEDLLVFQKFGKD